MRPRPPRRLHSLKHGPNKSEISPSCAPPSLERSFSPDRHLHLPGSNYGHFPSPGSHAPACGRCAEKNVNKKSEIRMPKSELKPKPECRKPGSETVISGFRLVPWTLFRISSFGILL